MVGGFLYGIVVVEGGSVGYFGGYSGMYVVKICCWIDVWSKC